MGQALPSHPELLDWLAVRFAQGSGFGVQGSASNTNSTASQLREKDRAPRAAPPEPRTLNPEPLHAFICEPVHNLIQHQLLTESESTFAAQRNDVPLERVAAIEAAKLVDRKMFE